MSVITLEERQASMRQDMERRLTEAEITMLTDKTLRKLDDVIDFYKQMVKEYSDTCDRNIALYDEMLRKCEKEVRSLQSSLRRII